MSLCSHELSPKKLPRGITPIKCERKEWPHTDDDRCILHTTERVKDIDELISEIKNSDRIDGLQLAQQEMPSGFIFRNMEIYGANFQNSELVGCVFEDAEIIHSRFEGADLDHAAFRPSKQSEVDESGITKSRIKLRQNNFNNAILTGVRFEKVSLLNTKLDAEKMDSIKFIDCSLPNIEFENQTLSDADFSYSTLRATTFIECDFYNTKFHATILDETRITDSDLRNADFRNAVLDQTDFSDVQVNRRTKFDDKLIQEYFADQYSEGKLSADVVSDIHSYLHSKRESIPISFEQESSRRRSLFTLYSTLKRLISRRPGTENQPDYSHLEHARYRYRDLSRIFSKNDEPDRARYYSVREKNTKRKNAMRNDNSSWIWLSFIKWTMKYGEEPKQPIITAFIIALLSAAAYPLLGVKYRDNGQIISYCLDCQQSVDATLSVVHLSIVRLFTPTNTEIEPVGFGVALGLFESIMGTLLFAMFVFTLGRRATE